MPAFRNSVFRPALSLALLSFLSLPALAADTFLKIVTTEQTLLLTEAEFEKLPHSEITVTDPHEKKEHRYSGVPMRDLLLKANVPLGEKLRGTAQQLAVLVRAKDGYGTVFALAEFDEAFSSRNLLLASKIDDQPLPINAAPLHLIVPGDKRAARWARMVTSIEIVRVVPPTP